jgi:O-antigen/teichoic acid export membrane protein
MTQPTILGKVSGAFPWALVGRAVRFAAAIVTSVVIVRALGVDYGVLALVRVTMAFLALPAGVGMGQALLRFLPELVVTTQGHGGRRLLVTGLLVQLGAWTILTLGVFFAGDAFDAFFHTDISGYLLLATFLLLVGGLRGFFDSALTASYEMRLLAILGTVGSLVQLAATWVLLEAGAGIPGVLLATAIGELVPAIGAMRRAFAVFREPAEAIQPRRLFGYSLPFVLLSVLNMITWKQSEIVFLGHFHSAEIAGVFDLAYKLPQQLLDFVPEAIWPLILAAMSESYTKNRHRLRELIDLYYRLLFLIVPPLSIFGIVLGDRILVILYGQEWASAGIYCQLLFAIFSLSFFGTPLSMAIYVLEKSWANFLLAFLFAAINVGLDLILIPRYGLVGAMIPVAIAIAVSPIARWFTLRAFVGSVSIPWGFIGRAYLVSSPLLLLVPFRGWITSLPALAVAGIAAAGIVFVSIRVFGLLSARERALIARSQLPMKGTLLRLFANRKHHDVKHEDAA